jgi:hypothetical protein
LIISQVTKYLIYTYALDIFFQTIEENFQAVPESNEEYLEFAAAVRDSLSGGLLLSYGLDEDSIRDLYKKFKNRITIEQDDEDEE